MDSTYLVRALDECVSYLSEQDGDWSRGIPGMDWTPAQAVAHIGEGMIWYAADATAGPTRLDAMELTGKTDLPPADLVRGVSSFGTVLARTLQLAPSGVIGWHPAGLCDMSGFAAMGCAELLVHTYDASLGIGTPFRGDPEVAAGVVARLCPDAAAGYEPWETLLWCHGRIPLGDLPRRERWRWWLDTTPH